MKILNSPSVQLNSRQQNKSQKADPSFKGAEALVPVLNFLETNQAIGASFVDIGCMGIPRTMTDFSRGPDAGLETMRREFSSTFVDAFIGAYGIGAAILISQSFNKDFGVKAQKMLISDEMLDITQDAYKQSKGNMDEYLSLIAKSTKGNGENGWASIDGIEGKFVKHMKEAVGKDGNNFDKEIKAKLKNILARETGAEKNFKIELNGKKAVSSLDAYLDDVFRVTKALTQKTVKETFGNFDKAESTFFKRLKGLNKKTSIIGIAIATALGASLQPINMYLTKKKTGKSGFVGVEGREPDKTKGFKILKAVAAATAGLAILSTIGKNPSEVLSRIKFKGILPTIPQYKFVYGFTIVSRLLAARDKNELREASIKDSLGFVNWLIFGGFVSKLTAAGFEKMKGFKKGDFIRHNKVEQNTKMKWLVDAPLVTREEILHADLKKAGKATIEAGKALNFKEMLKLASPEAKTKIKYLGFVQLAGYLYSGIVLGVGIPKLNIAITNGIEKKRKAKLEAEKAAKATQTSETTNQTAPASTTQVKA